MRQGSKRATAPKDNTWAKVKFDRQIVAIARVNAATTIYSDDEGVISFARVCGLTAIPVWALALPAAKQIGLDY
jgi:hypothetical protein